MGAVILKIGYGIVLIGTAIIRYPFKKQNKSNQVITNKKGFMEKNLLRLVIFGMWIIPLLYIFSNVLAFADYTLSISLHILGLVLIVPMLWLFYRSHKDLGKNWSESLEIRNGHQIVDEGLYKYVRHPMYSALWLQAVVQLLLLNNYVAGLSGLFFLGLLFFIRVKKEERMMLQQFGQEYANYMKRTKRIIPFII